MKKVILILLKFMSLGYLLFFHRYLSLILICGIILFYELKNFNGFFSNLKNKKDMVYNSIIIIIFIYTITTDIIEKKHQEYDFVAYLIIFSYFTTIISTYLKNKK